MGQSKLDYSLDFLLHHEGGLANHKDDPGGITNFGISLRWLKACGLDIDGDGDSDEDDIVALTYSKARDLYTEHWWNKYGYEGIEDADVAAKVLDMAVNMGGGTAHRVIQTALTKYGVPTTVDGKFGPNTIANLNQAVRRSGGSAGLLQVIRGAQLTHYRAIVTKNPRLSVFLPGWKNRALA